ncbi:MAG: hypothetical protein J7K40_02265 [candidate division Zixibacteria bacterium]|nr:hypothetical protein [candidate division Zixibacteria bacterium]
MYGAGAGAAAARRIHQEEESMTDYKKGELEGWEFKIIRANTAKFKNYETIQKLCQEEAKAGWEMVEKFDDYRIRFKRRVDKRFGDRYLDIDPYRTHLGMGQGKVVIAIITAFFLLGGLIVTFIMNTR